MTAIHDAEFGSLLQKLSEKKDLSSEEAAFCMHEIMHGLVPPEGIASFLTKLREKGETVEEITAFARIMRGAMLRVNFPSSGLVDTCGTGGDGSGTFNVSTCSAFVVAGTGLKVAKHGNRKASSSSGSIDVVEKLGLTMASSPQDAEQQLSSVGLTFMFAPAFHPAMKNVAPVRRQLAFKTVFNILGPLCNPAGAKMQVIGVYSKEVMPKLAGALSSLGTERALVVNSDTDEISISTPTSIIEINSNNENSSETQIEEYAVSPEDFGFHRAKMTEIAASGPEESARIILEVLSGKHDACRDIVLLNSAAAIYAGKKAASLKQGISLAEKSIDSGSAMEKLRALRSAPISAGGDAHGNEKQ